MKSIVELFQDGKETASRRDNSRKKTNRKIYIEAGGEEELARQGAHSSFNLIQILCVALLILSGIGILYLLACIQRVQYGEVALCKNPFTGDVELINEPGLHLRLLPGNNFQTYAKTEPYINYEGKFHIFTVPSNDLAFGTELGDAQIFGPGMHVIRSGTLNMVQDDHQKLVFGEQTAEEIKYGDITIVTVQEGQLAYGFDANELKIYEKPDRYLEVSPTYQFGKRQNLTDRVIQMGNAKTILNIPTGQCAIIYRYDVDNNSSRAAHITVGHLSDKKADSLLEGSLYSSIDQHDENNLIVINKPGYYELPSHYRFDHFLSLRKGAITMDNVQTTTGDNVALNLKATVFYHIENPREVAQSIDDQSRQTATENVNDGVENMILQRARAALCQIIQQHPLPKSALTSHKTDAVSEQPQASQASEKSATVCENMKAFENARAESIRKLQTEMKEMGIAIDDVRVESMTVADHAVQERLSQQAIDQAQAQAELNTAQLHKEAKIVAAEADAEATKLKAEAECEAMISLAAGRAAAYEKEAGGLEEAIKKFDKPENQRLLYLSMASKTLERAGNVTFVGRDLPNMVMALPGNNPS